jgi:hypothetical protein
MKKLKIKKPRKPAGIRLSSHGGSFILLIEDGRWTVADPYRGELNANQCRKLAAWLTRAANYIDQEDNCGKVY